MNQELEAIAVEVRVTIREDIPYILALERREVPQAKWAQAEDVISMLRQGRYVMLTALVNDQVVGYVMYLPRKSWLGLYCIVADSQRQPEEIGRQMVRNLQARLVERQRNRIVVKIPETSLGAQLFFKSLDFRVEKVLRDYFRHGDEIIDGYKFVYRTPGPKGGP